MNPNNLTELNNLVSAKLAEIAGLQSGHEEKYLKLEKSDIPVSSGALSCVVDQYQGKLGAGYLVRFRYKKDKVEWLMTENLGPETWRSFAWRKIRTD
jgi:hypothetical protein